MYIYVYIYIYTYRLLTNFLGCFFAHNLLEPGTDCRRRGREQATARAATPPEGEAASGDADDKADETAGVRRARAGLRAKDLKLAEEQRAKADREAREHLLKNRKKLEEANIKRMQELREAG